jgi:hypothetical protein
MEKAKAKKAAAPAAARTKKSVKRHTYRRLIWPVLGAEPTRYEVDATRKEWLKEGNFGTSEAYGTEFKFSDELAERFGRQPQVVPMEGVPGDFTDTIHKLPNYIEEARYLERRITELRRELELGFLFGAFGLQIRADDARALVAKLVEEARALDPSLYAGELWPSTPYDEAGIADRISRRRKEPLRISMIVKTVPYEQRHLDSIANPRDIWEMAMVMADPSPGRKKTKFGELAKYFQSLFGTPFHPQTLKREWFSLLRELKADE